MKLILLLVSILVIFGVTQAMHGMGFTNFDGWPSSGVSHVRIWDIGVTWRDIHVGVDSYDWSRLDALVNQIQSIGAMATYVIGATPQWLARYPDQPYYAPWLGPGSNSMPNNIDEFNKFVWNLATRYAGRIQYYEMWNEPQLSDFLYPYSDEEVGILAQMTKRAYSTMKSCDPGMMLISAAVLPRASSGGMSKASRYLSALQAYGWNVDAFATHIYPEVGVDPSGWHNMLVDAKNTIASFGPPTSKLWVTETNYNLLGPVIPEEQAPWYVNQTYSSAAAEGVQQIYWYAWNRPDIGGLQFSEGSSAWSAVQQQS